MQTRRSFMKSTLTAGAALSLPSAALAFTGDDGIIGHGDFKYKVDKSWGNQDPAKYPVKDCHEMVMDKKGRLILLTNHTQNNVLVYDRSGKILESWGLNLPGAHGLTLWEAGGEEFLFITDTDLHKVYKTTLDGKVLIELEYPKESGYENADEYKPTETAIAENGDIYIADGYGKNFITQYSSKGEFIRQFGGTGKNNDLFDCCHGVTIDTRSKTPELLITSRTSQQFKRFTMYGKHIETIELPGCWVCRPVLHGDYLYFAVIVTQSWGAYDGMVAVLDKHNKVVSFPGGSAPEYHDGSLLHGVSDTTTFQNPHDVCIDNDDNIYVPQWNSGSTYPVKLTRV